MNDTQSWARSMAAELDLLGREKLLDYYLKEFKGEDELIAEIINKVNSVSSYEPQTMEEWLGEFDSEELSALRAEIVAENNPDKIGDILHSWFETAQLKKINFEFEGFEAING